MKAEARAALARRIKVQPEPRMRPRRRGTPAAAPRELTLDERHAIVETFIILIDGLYPHIAQKRAAFGLDPVQRLRLLRQRIDDLDDDGFHRAMIGIVTDLRDSHTRFVGPSRQMGEIAFLPVMIEAYSEGGEDHYIISKVFALTPQEKASYTKAGLEAEVRVTHWNGVRIDRAVELHGQSRPAARRDAQRARALDSLTLRPLRYGLPADEDWVDVTFEQAGGRQGSVRLNWRTINLEDAPMVAKGLGRTLYAFAGDPATEAARRTKKALFAPDVWHADERGPASRPDVITAKEVQSDSGDRFGYLRLWSFDVIDDDLYLRRVREAIGRLPQNGLIIDLRGNPGGLIWAAERLLQLFTPNEISPVRFSFAATNLTRALANAPQGQRAFSAWQHSLDAALATGEIYSRAVPITPRARCNDIGQVYPGPVTAVVDARTYSAGDLFAAGFVDHRIGPLVSVDDATGGGGANVWQIGDVRRALSGTRYAIAPLPEDVTISLSVRRALRVGAGAEIEDVGVRGQFRHRLTKRDLLDGNKDLIEYCARLLLSESASYMAVSGDASEIVVNTGRLDRIDVYVDKRPLRASIDIGRDVDTHRIELPTAWSELDVRGYRGESLRQRRRFYPQDL